MSSIINISTALKHPGQSYAFQADAVLDTMHVLGDTVRFENIAATGTYITNDENVNLEGSASADVISHCARCLKEVRIKLRAPIDAEFVHRPDPEDPDQYSYDASVLDLTDAIKDALVLELPLRFLCREDCKGLCPRCGADLNLGSCTCQEGDDDFGPFAALRSIVQNNEEV